MREHIIKRGQIVATSSKGNYTNLDEKKPQVVFKMLGKYVLASKYTDSYMTRELLVRTVGRRNFINLNEWGL